MSPVACATHLRRAFVDALPKDFHDSLVAKSAEAVLRLNRVFAIEAELVRAYAEKRKEERLIREKPLLEDFWSWVEINSRNELPKSKLSNAFGYMLNHRDEFFNYLKDGNCAISNSPHCIRPFMIGRKNWLFCGSPRGAETSAGINTLVETVKANGLSPLKYIKYISYILKDMPESEFLQYPEYLDDYMPWNPKIIEICK